MSNYVVELQNLAADVMEIRDAIRQRIISGYEFADETALANDALKVRDSLLLLAAEFEYSFSFDGWGHEEEEDPANSHVSKSEEDTPENDEVTFDSVAFSDMLELAGISKAQFAKDSGYSRAMIGRLLKGETKRPHKATVKKLAKVLDCDPGDLDSRFHETS